MPTISTQAIQQVRLSERTGNLPGVNYVPQPPGVVNDPNRAHPHNRFASQHPQLNNPTVLRHADFARPSENTKFPTARYHRETGEGIVVYSEEELESLGSDYAAEKPAFAATKRVAQVAPTGSGGPDSSALEKVVLHLLASHQDTQAKLGKLLDSHAETAKAHAETQAQFGVLVAQVSEIGRQVIANAKPSAETEEKKGE